MKIILANDLSSAVYGPTFLNCHLHPSSITLKDCPGQGQSSVAASRYFPADSYSRPVELPGAEGG